MLLPFCLRAATHAWLQQSAAPRVHAEDREAMQASIGRAALPMPALAHPPAPVPGRVGSCADNRAGAPASRSCPAAMLATVLARGPMASAQGRHKHHGFLLHVLG
mmetsp:Transcript_18246/g.58022  ORF Transcript_18246/g.58022 Transcript_18246/m.58022 type:complete len:105 (+) Transcript_18246:445-759(+)